MECVWINSAAIGKSKNKENFMGFFLDTVNKKICNDIVVS